MSKYKLTIITLTILVFSMVVSGCYKKPLVYNSNNSFTLPSSNQSPIVSDNKENDLVSINIKWMTAGRLLDDLGLFFKKGSFSVSYFEVGKVIDGEYKDGRLILVSINDHDGLGVQTSFYRFVDKDNKFILLSRYSASLESRYFSVGNNGLPDKFVTNDNLVINDLDFPKFIIGSTPKQTIQIQPYNNVVTMGELFNQKGKNIIFNNEHVGPIYVGEGNSERYFIKSPDGVEIEYSLSGGFLANSIIDRNLITWNEGTKNVSSYIVDSDSTDGGNCQIGYSHVVTIQKNGIGIVGLKKIGEGFNGDSIFELKDDYNPILQALYSDLSPLGNSSLKMTYQEFLSLHPLIFWVDPFGRRIRFINMSLIEACG